MGILGGSDNRKIEGTLSMDLWSLYIFTKFVVTSSYNSITNCSRVKMTSKNASNAFQFNFQMFARVFIKFRTKMVMVCDRGKRKRKLELRTVQGNYSLGLRLS